MSDLGMHINLHSLSTSTRIQTCIHIQYVTCKFLTRPSYFPSPRDDRSRACRSRACMSRACMSRACMSRACMSRACMSRACMSRACMSRGTMTRIPRMSAGCSHLAQYVHEYTCMHIPWWPHMRGLPSRTTQHTIHIYIRIRKRMHEHKITRCGRTNTVVPPPVPAPAANGQVQPVPNYFNPPFRCGVRVCVTDALYACVRD
jgi:hypothetical protein